jgi:hypothetical protein
MESLVSIKSTIPKQLPGFIEEDHPIFKSFVEAYFEYVERTNGPVSFVRNALKYIDPSETLNEFISNFFEEMQGIPKDILANKSLLTQHIYELYQAKGTIKGYELLFRLMYDEDITIYLPKIDLLKPSDGKWTVDLVIRCKKNIGDPFYFIGKNIEQKDIYGQTTSVAKVENVIYKDDIDVYDIYISKNSLVGDFSLNYAECGSVIVDIEKSPSFYIKGERGTGYSPGDILKYYDGNSNPANAIVSEVYGNKISETIILDGGTGFSVGDKLNIISETGEGADIRVSEVSNGKITKLNIVSGGQGYQNIVRLGNISNCVIFGVGSGLGGIKKIQIRSPGTEYDSPPPSSVDTLAIITTPEPAGFTNNEHIEVLDNCLILETAYSIILEDGSRILSEDQDSLVYDYIISQSGDNTAKVSGFFNSATIEMESADGKILSEDGSPVVLEVSNGNINRRTIRGLISGSTSRIVYINPAEIDSKLDSIYNTGERFITDDGKISELTKKIQDSRYYQEFSYVIRSSHSINEYKNAILKLMHPAGTVMFGAIDIESRINLALRIVDDISSMVYKMLEIYIIHTTEIQNIFELTSIVSIDTKNYRNYAWLDRNKFMFGNISDSYIGCDLRTSSSMRDVPLLNSVIDRRNTTISALSNITFNDIYLYSSQQYSSNYVANGYVLPGYINIDTGEYSNATFDGYTSYDYIGDDYFEEEIDYGYPYIHRDGKLNITWESEITVV